MIIFFEYVDLITGRISYIQLEVIRNSPNPNYKVVHVNWVRGDPPSVKRKA